MIHVTNKQRMPLVGVRIVATKTNGQISLPRTNAARSSRREVIVDTKTNTCMTIFYVNVYQTNIIRR